jgi:flagellar motor switch/type III secretory pathway protein FliN
MNVAPYPWHRLRRLTRGQARLESTVAGWIAARSRGDRLGALVGGPVRVEVVESRCDGGRVTVPQRGGQAAIGPAFDPHAARCQVRVGGTELDVRGSSLGVRRIAQRVLGGPPELAAARPLGVVERSLWALVVATALEDLGVAGEVWPELDDIGAPDHRRGTAHAGTTDMLDEESATTVELSVVLGTIPLAVELAVPPSLALRVPPPRAWPRWFETTWIDVPIVLGRCALHRDDLARLAVRSLVTLERAGEYLVSLERAGEQLVGSAVSRRKASRPVVAELGAFCGSVGLRATAGALDAEVATGYVPRDMSLPDDAHVELTVGLGTTQLSLRQLADLSLGQIIQLGRPLAGPFELRAEGRVVGRGELVEVDGELAVRIVSLGD